MHIPDFHRCWVKKGYIGINDIELNLLYRPDYLNIKTLPVNYKEKVEDQYVRHISWIINNNTIGSVNNSKINNTVRQFEAIVSYLYSEDYSNKLPALLNYNKRLDKLRNETFSDILPELSGINEPN